MGLTPSEVTHAQVPGFLLVVVGSRHVRGGPAAFPGPRPATGRHHLRNRRAHAGPGWSARGVAVRHGEVAADTTRNGATGRCTITGSASSSGSRRRLRRPGCRPQCQSIAAAEMTGFDARVDYACRLVDDVRARPDRSTISAPPDVPRHSSFLTRIHIDSLWTTTQDGSRLLRHHRHAHQPGRHGPGAGVRSTRHPAADGSGRVRRPPRHAGLHLGGEPAPRRRAGRRAEQELHPVPERHEAVRRPAARSAPRAPRDTTSSASRSRR